MKLLKRNTQEAWQAWGIDLSITGPKENVQVNEKFARPVKAANATDTVNGSAVSENKFTMLWASDRSQLLGLLKFKSTNFISEIGVEYYA